MSFIVEIPFTKMTGAGNDFVVIDNFSGDFSFDPVGLTKALCDRHFGVGGDGVLIAERSEVADFKMAYYNSDGSYGGMCGNGGRCIARFMMNSFGKDSVSFEALDYIYSAKKYNALISLAMKDPNQLITNASLNIGGSVVNYHFVNTGSPHVVLFVEEFPSIIKQSFETKGVNEIGRAIRYHQVFAPEGTNVNFVTSVGEQSLSMRTYERGVEAETLACGTGTVACAIITSYLRDLKPPIPVKAQSGETLIVNFNKSANQFDTIELIGSAQALFTGKLKYHTGENRLIDIL